MTWTGDMSDPQYEISRAVYEQLKAATDARGRKLEIHKIHQPDPLCVTQEEVDNLDLVETTKPRYPGDRLTASYINFYIANGGVIVPLLYNRHLSSTRLSRQSGTGINIVCSLANLARLKTPLPPNRHIAKKLLILANLPDFTHNLDLRPERQILRRSANHNLQAARLDYIPQLPVVEAKLVRKQLKRDRFGLARRQADPLKPLKLLDRPRHRHIRHPRV
jgi:hypothetical protein